MTVLNNLDGGTGSLRADIAGAQSGDTIIFAPSLSGQTITLTSGELLIKQNLTITAPGALNLTVNGGGGRVFEVAANYQVSLSGLTISGGNVGINYYGGGISNGGTLTVSACTLYGNSADHGGGIYNSGSLTVSGCTLSANSAIEDGAGIYNRGTATIANSTLSGNRVPGLDFLLGDGGGIYNDHGGTLTVTGSTMSSNSVGGHGGAIYNAGTLTVSGSTLSGSSAYQGGGIFNAKLYNANYGGKLTVSSSVVHLNVADVGADLFNLGLAHIGRGIFGVIHNGGTIVYV